MIEFIIGAVIGVGIGFLIGVAACIWLLSGEEDGAWEQPYASAMGDGDEEWASYSIVGVTKRLAITQIYESLRNRIQNYYKKYMNLS